MAHADSLIPPRREDALLNGGNVSQRYIEYFEELANVSNLTGGDVEDLQTQIFANDVDIAANGDDILDNANDIITNQLALGDLTVKTSNFTTTRTQRIICNAAITITLDGTPQDDDKVYIKRVNGQVTIDGNGNNIDGETSITLVIEYTSVLLTYSSTLGDWFIM